MRPILTEQYLENGDHANWTLTDEDTGKVLWQEWHPQSFGKFEYDFVNRTEKFIKNPNKPDTSVGDTIQ